MKKTIPVSILFLTIFLIGRCHAQIPAWQWVRTADNGDSRSICTDMNGNVSITGYFSDSSITFGNITLHAIFASFNGANSFVVKYGPSGNVIWAKLIGGRGWDYSNDICCDSSGNIYISGEFMDDSLILGATVLSTAGSMDNFIAKIDPAGNVIWAKRIGGSDMENESTITVNKGHVVVAGSFYSPILSVGAISIAHSSGWNEDFYVARFDTIGNIEWVRASIGTNYEYARSITLDSAGNIYSIGNFGSDSVRFGNITLTHSNADHLPDIFIVKYDSSGTVAWAKSFGSNNEDYGQSIFAYKNGDILIGGFYSGDSIRFGNFIFTNQNNSRLFLVKIDATGNVIWAKEGTDGGTELNDIQADDHGNIFITGQIWAGGLTFGNCTITLPSISDYADIFVMKFDSYGNSIWGKGIFGNNSDDSYGISIDRNSNIYVVGNLSPDILTFDNLFVNSNGGLFLAKLAGVTAINENFNSGHGISCFPNPFSDKLIVESKLISDASLLDLQGKVIKKLNLNPGENEIDTHLLNPGIYFLQIITSEGMASQKVIKAN